jgi:hypothetical protein
MIEIVFHNYIQAQIGKPFVWGQNDCNTFVLKMVDHFQGTDYADDVVGQYSTKLGALRFAKRIGTLRDYLPLQKIPRNHAQTGDLILVKDKLFDRAHICTGSKVISVIENSITTQMPMVEGDVYRWRLWAR